MEYTVGTWGICLPANICGIVPMLGQCWASINSILLCLYLLYALKQGLELSMLIPLSTCQYLVWIVELKQVNPVSCDVQWIYFDSDLISVILSSSPSTLDRCIRSYFFIEKHCFSFQIFKISPPNQHHCVCHPSRVKQVRFLSQVQLNTEVTLFGYAVYSQAVLHMPVFSAGQLKNK